MQQYNLFCHNRKINTKEYKVITKLGKQYNYLTESIKEGYCSYCKTFVILHTWQSSYNGKDFYNEYRGKAAKKFLKNVIQKQKCYQEEQVDKRYYLNYREYGKTNDGNIKKCYSNFNSLRLGMIDPDKGLDFFAA
jgi:hypothetical protein